METLEKQQNKTEETYQLCPDYYDYSPSDPIYIIRKYIEEFE